MRDNVIEMDGQYEERREEKKGETEREQYILYIKGEYELTFCLLNMNNRLMCEKRIIPKITMLGSCPPCK